MMQAPKSLVSRMTVAAGWSDPERRAEAMRVITKQHSKDTLRQQLDQLPDLARTRWLHEALSNESGLGGQEEPLPSITQKEAGE